MHVLGDADGRIVRVSPNGEYIRVTAPIAKWEELFGGGTSKLPLACICNSVSILLCSGNVVDPMGPKRFFVW